MFRVLGCIYEQHDLRLVALAAVLCLLASATAMSTISRARAAQGWLCQAWLVIGGAVAGCGIWGLHFVAMLAYGTGLPVTYDPLLTCLSALIAMSLCAVGFLVAVERGPFLGGAITGAAISAMHYAGMSGVRIAARAQWDQSYVAASVVIGVVLTVIAFTFALRRNDIKGYALGAGLLLVAIVGLHFTAMAAVVYVPDPLVPIPEAVLQPAMLAVTVAAMVTLIMGLALIGALVDGHLESRAGREAERMRTYIAELEATKADLSQALEAAEAGGRAKAAFFASMGHELRTPLNAVIGFSEIMLQETFGALGSPRYRDYLGHIRDGGTKLLTLINDILDISRFDAGKGELIEETFDLALKIKDVIRMMDSQARQGRIELLYNLPPDLPQLYADKRRIRQILLNLISNSLKFTPPGGKVVVSATVTEQGLELIVHDTGIGIAPHDLGKALEPFGQVDSSLARKYEGMGLGLPITRQMAELHGGGLTLESQLDLGTTVIITLPARRLMTVEETVAA